jgi:hypothetical protein
MRKLFFTISTLVALALPAVAQAEVGEAEAMTTAIRYASNTGLTGPLEIQSSGPVQLARAQTILNHEAPNPAPPPTTAFPFVFKSSSPFEPHVPVPRGGHLHVMSYLEVTISPVSLGVNLSPTPISIAPLGTVVTVDLSSDQATASTRGSCQVDQLLVTALGRKHLHARLASAQHSLARCEAKHP